LGYQPLSKLDSKQDLGYAIVIMIIIFILTGLTYIFLSQNSCLEDYQAKECWREEKSKIS